MYRLRVTGPAKQDVRTKHAWRSENRSKEQADRWLNGIDGAIQSLRQKTHRCGRAPETELLEQGVRQLLYGIGHRPTHCIVFTITESEVVIFRIRGVGQDALSAKDLGT